MAKKPARPAATQHIEEIPPAMDYAQHQATWKAVITLVKWTLVGIAFILVALYCFIEGRQPVLGTLLLLVVPIGAVVLAVSRVRAPA
jgi:hypothetical protein